MINQTLALQDHFNEQDKNGKNRDAKDNELDFLARKIKI